VFRRRFTRRNVLAALVFVLAVSALAGYVAPSADALPANETWTTYFSDASHTTPIGERAILCSGQTFKWGSLSIHKETISFPCGW